MKYSTLLLYLVLLFTRMYSFCWPIGTGEPWYDHPQRITSTFGEYRPGTNPHFHTGVDMIRNDGQASNLPVYGVEGDDIVLRIVRNQGYYNFVVTSWHIFAHIDPLPNLQVGQQAGPTTQIATIYDITGAHLHFTSTIQGYTSGTNILGNGHENNPLDTTTVVFFDSLYPDHSKPKIYSVEFFLNGPSGSAISHNRLPSRRGLDIVVKAEERTAYPDGNNQYAVDTANGVYKLGYGINSPPYLYNLKFNEQPGSWILNRVYDSRSNQSNFYYIVTNRMNADDSIVLSPGAYTIYISAVDEQGNDSTISVNVTATGIEEEANLMNVPTSFRLVENRPNPFSYFTTIPFQLPKETEMSLAIYDKGGRKVKTLIQEKKQPGYYKAIWGGRDEYGKKVANGIYFVKLQTKDFSDIKKMVLLK